VFSFPEFSGQCECLNDDVFFKMGEATSLEVYGKGVEINLKRGIEKNVSENKNNNSNPEDN
jgi:hypothetical protein